MITKPDKTESAHQYISSTTFPTEDDLNYDHTFGKARPLKIWRRSIVAKNKQSRSKHIVDTIIPNSILNPPLSKNPCSDLPSSDSTFLLTRNLEKNHINERGVNIDCIRRDDSNIHGYFGSTPDNIRKYSANTKINSNYHQNYKNYLQNRCLLYDQHSHYTKRDGVTYFDANGNPIPASDSTTGSQTFQMTTCNNNNCFTTQKPSNTKFNTRGAVSGSSRLHRLATDTRTQNANSLRMAFNKQQHGLFITSTDTPMIEKKKIGLFTNPVYRIGNRSISCNQYRCSTT